MNFFRLLSIFLFVSCASKEYYQVKNSCKSVAYQQIPANYVQRTYTVSVHKSVPSGEFNCNTASKNDYSYYGGSTVYGRGTASTHCSPVYKNIMVNEDRLRTVDLNESYRDSEINKCVYQICNAKFGNKDCDQSN
jgi:hypothetical protein